MSSRLQADDAMKRITENHVRGVVTDSRDDEGMIFVDVELDGGRKFTNVELPEQAGYSYRPADGAEVWMEFVNGNPSHPVVSQVSDRRARPRGTLEKGEGVLWNQQGHIIRMKGDSLTIETSAPVEINTAAGVTITGNLHVDGDITTTGTNPNAHSH